MELFVRYPDKEVNCLESVASRRRLNRRPWSGHSAAQALLQLGQFVFDPVRFDLGLRSTLLGIGRLSGFGGGAVARELPGRFRRRLVRLALQIEDVAAHAAAVLALLVTDEVDEEHAVALADLDLVEARRAPALGTGLDEAVPVANHPGLRIAVEEQPHEVRRYQPPGRRRHGKSRSSGRARPRSRSGFELSIFSRSRTSSSTRSTWF